MCALCMFSRWWIITLSEKSDQTDQRASGLWIFSSVEEVCAVLTVHDKHNSSLSSLSSVFLLALSMNDNIPSLES